MTGEARTELLAALADVGVEPDDYALIQQARTLVDKVNARLRARRSTMVYSVTFCAASPSQTSGPDSARNLEEQPGETEADGLTASHPLTAAGGSKRPPLRTPAG